MCYKVLVKMELRVVYQISYYHKNRHVVIIYHISFNLLPSSGVV